VSRGKQAVQEYKVSLVLAANAVNREEREPTA
jgi:hypothetical protein